jgi:diadenosine tetraphosphate (Ap4A) HIT family hydrolase
VCQFALNLKSAFYTTDSKRVIRDSSGTVSNLLDWICRDRRAGSGFVAFMAFSLHSRLAAGGFELGRIGGCRLLLKNNALFPWLLLVPEVEGIEDLHQLEPDRYEEVMLSVRKVSVFVSNHFQPEKLNVACIGNQVRQMHIHIVGRSTGDPAWPGTVWAFDGKQGYSDDEVAVILGAARASLPLV